MRWITTPTARRPTKPIIAAPNSSKPTLPKRNFPFWSRSWEFAKTTTTCFLSGAALVSIGASSPAKPTPSANKRRMGRAICWATFGALSGTIAPAMCWWKMCAASSETPKTADLTLSRIFFGGRVMTGARTFWTRLATAFRRRAAVMCLLLPAFYLTSTFRQKTINPRECESVSVNCLRLKRAKCAAKTRFIVPPRWAKRILPVCE